jgi:hypothetical protein
MPTTPVWCLFLTAFFLMIRKSNLVPNSAKTFQYQKQLIRENIEFDSKSYVLIFHINWSKTIQYGETELIHLEFPKKKPNSLHLA